ncbi:MAG TPA: hypothetical protein VGH28_16270 [Polyangiaceae bacterium]|jgi:hypothetical protein
MDRDVHARYLQYREAFAYFATAGQHQLDGAEFQAADTEQTILEKKGAARTDEEEQRFIELSLLLFRD